MTKSDAAVVDALLKAVFEQSMLQAPSGGERIDRRTARVDVTGISDSLFRDRVLALEREFEAAWLLADRTIVVTRSQQTGLYATEVILDLWRAHVTKPRMKLTRRASRPQKLRFLKSV